MSELALRRGGDRGELVDAFEEPALAVGASAAAPNTRRAYATSYRAFAGFLRARHGAASLETFTLRRSLRGATSSRVDEILHHSQRAAREPWKSVDWPVAAPALSAPLGRARHGHKGRFAGLGGSSALHAIAQLNEPLATLDLR